MPCKLLLFASLLYIISFTLPTTGCSLEYYYYYYSIVVYVYSRDGFVPTPNTSSVRSFSGPVIQIDSSISNNKNKYKLQIPYNVPRLNVIDLRWVFFGGGGGIKLFQSPLRALYKTAVKPRLHRASLFDT